MRAGTGAVEIKSGYGLRTADELKMLRVARRIGVETPLTVKTTFLGAHAIPQETTKEKYIESVIKEMIPAVADEKLADYIDVFCETGFFSADETERIINEGKRFGMKPRIHANQLNRSGGVQVGVRTGAISVDHSGKHRRRGDSGAAREQCNSYRFAGCCIFPRTSISARTTNHQRRTSYCTGVRL